MALAGVEEAAASGGAASGRTTATATPRRDAPSVKTSLRENTKDGTAIRQAAGVDAASTPWTGKEVGTCDTSFIGSRSPSAEATGVEGARSLARLILLSMDWMRLKKIKKKFDLLGI
jgi:hypothetical protein